MALLARIFVVLFAFAASCLATTAVAALAYAATLEDVRLILDHGGGWIVIGLYGVALASLAFLPAMLVLLVAEAMGIRALLFYAAVGALGALAFYFGYGLEPMSGLTLRHELEILAAAGIAGGFVYWLIAGRNAGRWRRLAA